MKKREREREREKKGDLIDRVKTNLHRTFSSFCFSFRGSSGSIYITNIARSFKK